jgi:hypothetical protein
MLCGLAACGLTPRIENAGSDPAVLDDCPRTVESPGPLPAREPFRLPDGRMVVPLDQANARENALTGAALIFRGLWVECRSVVVYIEQREAGLAH